LCATKYTSDDLVFEKLTQETDLSGFCCKKDQDDDPLEVDDFIHNYSKDHLEKKLSATWLCKHGEQIVGAISLSMSSIRVDDLTEEEAYLLEGLPFKQIPVLLLGQIGTDVDHRRRNVCKEMCDFGISAAARMSKDIGCRYVALSTIQELVHVYERIGFIRKNINKQRIVMTQRI
jgi:hypothetical protein